MRRREAIAGLLGAAVGRSAELGRFLQSADGAAVLVDVPKRRLIAAHNAEMASRSLEPPGSTMKPLVLASLLSNGKLGAEESFPCSGRLSIGGHSLDCSHPKLAEAMRPRTAVAYSCNSYVAQVASRFDGGELARELERFGLRSASGLFGERESAGRLRAATTPDATKLQALGEEGVAISLAELAMAYRQLALRVGDASLRPIVEGLEDAVSYGTAQKARIDAVVAGKTGSVRTPTGAWLAWFAGFVPSRSPEVVVAVVLQGYSGGSDAAPVGGRILEAYRAGKL
jgi:cell division protein FtsI/penicillin-binding protein 2